ncbi:MAG: tRNA lysidine(34) synthetase TilS [Ignavibacteriales bacterium]|nr:tRNA lysidine(34) synthetase TilS [Ignavibacteriales bacterium]
MPDTIFLKFKQFCRSEKLIERNDKVIIALSGGADSIFLLTLIQKLQPQLSLEVTAVHINHNLRGEESDNDEKFCRELCFANGIPFYSNSVDVKQLSVEKKISIEMAAREARYFTLEKVREKLGYSKIATAHNMDDNSETVLLNLIKGKGVEAVSGIPVVRGNIIRPVIIFSKSEIIEWLSKQNIRYQFDSTNVDNKFQRNFLRNKVTPLLEEINPEFSLSILRFSQMLRQLTISANEPSIDPIVIKDKAIEININLAKKVNDFWLFKSLSIRIIEHFSLNLKFEIFYNIKDLLVSQPGRKIDIGEGVTCFRSRNELIISRAEMIDLTEMKLLVNSKTVFGGYEISCEKVEEITSFYNNDRSVEYVDGDKTDSIFTVRSAKKGESFFPVNGKGKRKLSDFFNDLKMEPNHKWEHPILFAGERVVWVCGHRLDDRFKISDKTKTIFKLEIKENE